jgi:hypothetical protein
LPKDDARSSPPRLWLLWLPPICALLLIIAGAYFARHELWPPAAADAEIVYPLIERHLSAAEALEETIRTGALELGVPGKGLARRRGAEGWPRFEMRCPAGLHPIAANRWLSRILADADVQILDCAEDGTLAQPTLTYRLAAGPGQAAQAELVLLAPERAEAPPSGDKPRLALVLEGLGHAYEGTVGEMMDLGLPLTAGILPGRRASARIEREARGRGHAVFMLQPMEPADYPGRDPGRGAIFAATPPDSIRAILKVNSRRFQRLDGLGSYLGSRACRVDAVVAPLLSWAREGGLIVLDATGDPHSRFPALGSARGQAVLRSDLVLDGAGEDEGLIMANLARAADTARRRGWAVAVIHPRPQTLAALRTMGGRLDDYALRFVTLPELAAGLDFSDPALQVP